MNEFDDPWDLVRSRSLETWNSAGQASRQPPRSGASGMKPVMRTAKRYEHRRAKRRCRPKFTRSGTHGLLHFQSAMPWQMHNMAILLYLPMTQRGIVLCQAKTEGCSRVSFLVLQCTIVQCDVFADREFPPVRVRVQEIC